MKLIVCACVFIITGMKNEPQKKEDPWREEERSQKTLRFVLSPAVGRIHTETHQLLQMTCMKTPDDAFLSHPGQAWSSRLDLYLHIWRCPTKAPCFPASGIPAGILVNASGAELMVAPRDLLGSVGS